MWEKMQGSRLLRTHLVELRQDRGRVNLVLDSRASRFYHCPFNEKSVEGARTSACLDCPSEKLEGVNWGMANQRKAMVVVHCSDFGTCLQVKTVAKSVLTAATSKLNIPIEETCIQ